MHDINNVTPEKQARLDAIARECHELHIPVPIKTFVTATLFDKPGGQEVMRIHDMAQTWNLNYYKMVGWMFLAPPAGLMANTDSNLKEYPQNFTLVSTANAGVNLIGTGNPHQALNSWEFGGSHVDDGIIIGVGTDDDTIQTFQMPNQLKQTGIVGTAVSDNSTVWDGTAKTWTQLVRKFFHNAVLPQEDFMVTEVGLIKNLGVYTKAARNAAVNTAAAEHRILLDRTKLVQPVPFTYNSMLRVDYTLVFTLPNVPMLDGTD